MAFPRRLDMIRIPTRPAAVSLAMLVVLATLSSRRPFAQAPAPGTVALTGARVTDGTGRAPLDRATLVVSNGRIVAVGASAAVKVPAGATRIALPGKPTIPAWLGPHPT